jgi:hypothetical protein
MGKIRLMDVNHSPMRKRVVCKQVYMKKKEKVDHYQQHGCRENSKKQFVYSRHYYLEGEGEFYSEG